MDRKIEIASTEATKTEETGTMTTLALIMAQTTDTAMERATLNMHARPIIDTRASEATIATIEDRDITAVAANKPTTEIAEYIAIEYTETIAVVYV